MLHFFLIFIVSCYSFVDCAEKDDKTWNPSYTPNSKPDKSRSPKTGRAHKVHPYARPTPALPAVSSAIRPDQAHFLQAQLDDFKRELALQALIIESIRKLTQVIQDNHAQTNANILAQVQDEGRTTRGFVYTYFFAVMEMLKQNNLRQVNPVAHPQPVASASRIPANAFNFGPSFQAPLGNPALVNPYMQCMQLGQLIHTSAQLQNIQQPSNSSASSSTSMPSMNSSASTLVAASSQPWQKAPVPVLARTAAQTNSAQSPQQPALSGINVAGRRFQLPPTTARQSSVHLEPIDSSSDELSPGQSSASSVQSSDYEQTSPLIRVVPPAPSPSHTTQMSLSFSDFDTYPREASWPALNLTAAERKRLGGSGSPLEDTESF